MMNLHFRLIARHFYNFGFNLTEINDYLFDSENESNYFEHDTEQKDEVSYKSPNHKWFHLKVKRQSEQELENLPWEFATGIGTILGYKRLRALDIDFISDKSLIYNFLEILELPDDYEWVVKSGSGKGFHIIFYCSQHEFPVSVNQNKAFKSKASNDGEIFERLELRWCGHLVLPPSNHRSGETYSFLSGKMPSNPPMELKLESLNNFIELFCLNKQVKGSSGTFLDYGHSKLSHNISIINEDLSLIFKKPFTLHFSCSISQVIDKENKKTENRLSGIQWKIFDARDDLIEYCNFIAKPNGYMISEESTKIHRIPNNIAYSEGVDIEDLLIAFRNRMEITENIINDNLFHDMNTLKFEYEKMGIWHKINNLK